MTDADQTPDPLDLPMFGTPPVTPKLQGRVRSTYKYPGPFEPDGAAAALLRRTEFAQRSTPPVPPELPLQPTVLTGRPPLRSIRSTAGVDWALVAGFRAEVSERLSDALGGALWSRTEQESQGWAIIRQVLDEDAATTLASGGKLRSTVDQEAMAHAVFDSVFRLGRLQPLIDDDRIENIMIIRFDRVVAEFSDGTMHWMDPVADSDEELADFLAFLAGRSDNPRPFSPANPSLHLNLECGARLAAALDTAGLSVVIRRHRHREVTLSDLVATGSLTPVVANFLRAAVRARKSIVVSGPQGAGKTTLVRALCAEIDPWEPIGTFETEFELFLHEMPDKHHIVFAWEVQSGSGERGPDGRPAGERTIAAQVIDSFRYNLGRQILGEIRGPEVWSMVKLMESGSGSISTTHAADGQAAMRKLITCAMEAGPQVSQELAAAKLADTLDVIVQLACDIGRGDPDGSTGRKHRYVAEILEVTPERAS